jgi:hypothetical protein
LAEDARDRLMIDRGAADGAGRRLHTASKPAPAVPAHHSAWHGQAKIGGEREAALPLHGDRNLLAAG